MVIRYWTLYYGFDTLILGDFVNQVFDVKINIMENVDLDIISNIERKCMDGDGLSPNELDYYLNYVVYQTRFLLSFKKNENINDYKFNFMCDTAQSIIARYFESLNIICRPVETQKAITSDILGHSFLIAEFNVNGEFKKYIVDPTYNQFFDIDRCSESNFKVINGIVVKTPDLGYFALKEDEDKQMIIKNLIKCGFMELTLENAKAYGDLFYKTKTGNINYLNAKLEMSGLVYIKSFEKSVGNLSYTSEELSEMGIALEPIYKEILKKTV